MMASRRTVARRRAERGAIAQAFPETCPPICVLRICSAVEGVGAVVCLTVPTNAYSRVYARVTARENRYVAQRSVADMKVVQRHNVAGVRLLRVKWTARCGAEAHMAIALLASNSTVEAKGLQRAGASTTTKPRARKAYSSLSFPPSMKERLGQVTWTASTTFLIVVASVVIIGWAETAQHGLGGIAPRP